MEYLDKETLKKLYTDEGRSKTEICSILCVSYKTLKKYIEKYNLVQPKKYDIEQIKKWYIEDKMTSREICKLIGTASGTVIRILRKAGVEIRPTGNMAEKEYHIVSPFKQEVKDIDKMIELFNKCVPVNDIAKELNTGRNAVDRKIKELNLVRPRSMNSREQYDSTNDAEIVRLYEEGYSSTEIAKRFNTTHGSILKHLKHNGIISRSLSESQFTKNKKEFPEELKIYESLYDLYVIKRLSKKDIAETFNIATSVVDRCLKEFNIKVRDNSEAKVGLFVGDKHPNWKGGRCGLYVRIREYLTCNIIGSVVKRDGKKCQMCGSTHKLQVHHIRSFKDIFEEILSEHPELDIKDNENELYNIMVKDPRMNDTDNLITYCKECHLFKVHGYKKGATERIKKRKLERENNNVHLTK